MQKLSLSIQAKILLHFLLKPNMSLVFLLLLLYPSLCLASMTELDTLMVIKASLDPENRFLTSWTRSSNPCSGTGAFEGVGCNELGKVANISLQGKGLSGQLPAALAGLKSLTGLYLHFNALNGKIPKQILSLSQLTDLYLNVNNLSGDIPLGVGNLSNLQVLQLSYNKFSGSIPNEVGSMKKLSVFSLQYNDLTGTIPASLGNLGMLRRLDLSFNRLFGPIPVRLAIAPALEVLDIRNNSLSGNIPSALKRLKRGFLYGNNPGLCGVGFPYLESCGAVKNFNPDRPEPYQPNNLSTKDLPESVNLEHHGNKNDSMKESKSPEMGVVLGVVGVIIALTLTGIIMFTWYRRRKQKIVGAFDSSDNRQSTDQVKEVCKRNASPLISLEYSNGWDPLAKGRSGYSQEVLESFMFNLEEVERATQWFSEVNLLGKSNFSAVYKGILRDGSVVAIKCISKTSCKSDETAFLKGLKLITSLKHENLVRLRGFCCSRGRGECFLIHEFVPNGSLLQYLDVKNGNGKVLEWSTRVSIIKGIAKGIGYLHRNKGSKHAIIHQNISAEKIFIDAWYNALLSDAGLHKLLADDVVFSTLKASAAMGYLAPEYATTARLTEKSDVYAFGVIVFQLLSGKQNVTQSIRQGAETSSFEDYVDENLQGKFIDSEAAKLGRIALLCTHESPNRRPSMDHAILELDENIGTA